MKHRKVTNVAASVRQRLLNEARATGRPFNELLQYFAMERFLYRLSKSPHSEKFVLKGALMFPTWDVSLTLGADGGVRGGHREGHAVAGVSAEEPTGGRA